jgi:alkanesulfonate monooxygenase SsuD/methylene tetrahydromethanopterin reductase-like flavin-dependent oxidoreductase (luciferase family)
MRITLEATMPARIIGMIGVTPPQKEATLLVIEGEISPRFVAQFAQAHEAAGFDMVLVGYSSSSAEAFLVAQYAADQTERISYLVAHRPGFVAPTLFARKVATFDHLTSGRLALYHYWQDGRRAAGGRRLHAQGRALPTCTGIPALDEAHLGQRDRFRFRRPLL